jgi:hypothetical protein
VSPWPSRRFTLAGVALALLATGCVRPDPPGVGVQKLAADIVFGVKPPAPDTPPPNLAPGAAGPGDAVTYVPSPASPEPSFGLPAFREPRSLSAKLPRPTPLSAPRSPCPPAALTAFPAQEAGLNALGNPVEGQYRWKREGTQTLATLPGIKLPVSGFEQRLIRNVKKISETEFTFETVQPELSGGVTTISTFKVKTDGVSKTVNAPVSPPDVTHPTTPVPIGVTPPTPMPTLPKPPIPESARAGDPDGGVVLTKLQRVDAHGNSSELTFSPGVMYLPLPIAPGEQFNSVGIDPRSGSVLQHQARVIRRQRVDACGEIVDGWLIEATQTFSGAAATATSTSPSRTYNYIVAPQLGGIIISEAVHVASPDGTSDITFSLGQLRPSALPAQAQAGG